MFPQSKRSTFLVLGLAILVGVESISGSQLTNDGMPSLGSLKTVDYTQVANNEQGELVTNTVPFAP